MFKRQTSGPQSDPKKPKLDLARNGSSLPSTNKEIPSSSNQVDDDAIWGNIDDDEILLLASQACETVDKDDETMSIIADYTFCMKPPLTSTQKTVVCAEGTFKMPVNTEAFYSKQNNLSTDTCNRVIGRISSPSTSKKPFNDTFKSDKILNVQDQKLDEVQHLLNELRTVMVTKDKLENDHAILMEKYIMKEGETTNLRMQVKQVLSQADTVRMQKLKMEEQKDIEFKGQMTKTQREMEGLKAKMEFQVLEISNLKEKCRMLEKGSKIKLVEPSPTQIKKAWPSFSQKMSNTSKGETPKHSVRDAPIQTDSVDFVRLNTKPPLRYPLLEDIPKCIFNHKTAAEEVVFQFDSNRDSVLVNQSSSFSSVRKRILSEFSEETGRTPVPERTTEEGVKFQDVHDDIVCLMEMTQDEICRSGRAIEHSFKVSLYVNEFLLRALQQLQDLASKVSPLTIREMDDMYLQSMRNVSPSSEQGNLFDESGLCKNEQAIDARRLLSVLAKICRHNRQIAEHVIGAKALDAVDKNRIEELLKKMPLCQRHNEAADRREGCLIGLTTEICKKIGFIGCSHMYPGLQTSISLLLKHCVKICSADKLEECHSKILELLKELVLLRPTGRVLEQICKILRHLATSKVFLMRLCCGAGSGNMMLDYSQGVVLYNSDSCFLQVLCCQLEVWSVRYGSLSHTCALTSFARGLMDLVHSATHFELPWIQFAPSNKCQCCFRIFQSMTTCLYRCAKLYEEWGQYTEDENLRKRLTCVLRQGVLALSWCFLQELEFPACLRDQEGDLQMFLSILNSLGHQLNFLDIHRDALADMSATINPRTEEQEPFPAEAKTIWDESFKNFFITD